jgi:hypothetical protein
MGYVKGVDLMAFLTQKGKKYFFDTNKKKVLITHFSLADPDSDYLVASSTTINTIGGRNILPEYSVPNLSGIYGVEDSCLRYLADGIVQKGSIYGGDDVNVIITKNLTPMPVPPLLILYLQNNNYQYFGGPETNYAYNTNNDVIDYVYSNLKNKNLDTFDISLSYRLLNSDTNKPLFADIPLGIEEFNFTVVNYDQELLTPQSIDENNLVNTLKVNNEPNKYVLLKNDIISSNTETNLLYLKGIEVNKFMLLPIYGWNTVGEFKLDNIINLSGATLTPTRTPIYTSLIKKLRFYKPTIAIIEHAIQTLVVNNTLNLGDVSTYKIGSQYSVPSNHIYKLVSNSPEGLESLVGRVASSDARIKNIRFDTNINNETITFDKGDIDKIVNANVIFDVDDSTISDGTTTTMGYTININTVNDFVLKNTTNDIITYNFDYIKPLVIDDPVVDPAIQAILDDHYMRMGVTNQHGESFIFDLDNIYFRGLGSDSDDKYNNIDVPNKRYVADISFDSTVWVYLNSIQRLLGDPNFFVFNSVPIGTIKVTILKNNLVYKVQDFPYINEYSKTIEFLDVKISKGDFIQIKLDWPNSYSKQLSGPFVEIRPNTLFS